MKRLLLNNLNLSESNILSINEKRITYGGYMGCGTGWKQCRSGRCVLDVSECPDGEINNPCIDGYPLPSGNCSDPE